MSPVHINLDDAWNPALLPSPFRTIDARPLGPHLRYIAPEKIIQRSLDVLTRALGPEETTILYGSGDFHYLAAWWLKRVLALNPSEKAVTVISFDNHPDWDIRPPRWACGGWINRALEFPEIKKASVWGCGNFELTLPSRLFRNRSALKFGTLEIYPWAERQPPAIAKKFNAMTRENWRERFTTFATSLTTPIYITIDLDALSQEHAITNWENGLFTPEDLIWALSRLSTHKTIGLDLCGAYSPPTYARPLQKFAATFDHPKTPPHTLEGARILNHQTLTTLLPILTKE